MGNRQFARGNVQHGQMPMYIGIHETPNGMQPVPPSPPDQNCPRFPDGLLVVDRRCILFELKDPRKGAPNHV